MPSDRATCKGGQFPSNHRRFRYEMQCDVDDGNCKWRCQEKTMRSARMAAEQSRSRCPKESTKKAEAERLRRDRDIQQSRGVGGAV
jgi:hypothetical protein